MAAHRGGPGALTVRRVFAGLIVVLAALDLLILAIRLSDVALLGRLFLFPAEGPVLYAIWKIGHGYPLYEWPTRPYFVLTLYNFLFYQTYAAVLAALRVPSDGLAIAGRYLTAVFAAAGAVGQYVAVRRVTRVPPSFRLPLAALSVAAWFGCALPGWWTLSIRPDVPAAAISTWGMVAALTAFASGRRGWLLAAGGAFVVAWAFKQSQIALFAATGAYVLLWRRSMTELVLLTLPFAAGAALALVAGGAVYRANILDAARVNALIPYLTVYWYRSVVLTDLLLWGMALHVAVALLRPGSRLGPPRSLADIAVRSGRLFGVDVTYPLLATIAAGAAGAILLAKIGSALNHILELNVAAALLCGAVLAAAWETPAARRLLAAGAMMMLPMIAFEGVLLWNDSGRAAAALQLKGWGTHLHLTTPAAVRDRERVAAEFAKLPQPVFTDDELFAQPWHATGDNYPTVILDHVFYDAARSKGLVGRGVEGLFEDRYFAAAVVPPSSAYLAIALRASYRIQTVIAQPDGDRLYVLVREP